MKAEVARSARCFLLMQNAAPGVGHFAESGLKWQLRGLHLDSEFHFPFSFALYC